MKNIEFKNKSAQKIYNDYIQRARKELKILSKEDQVDTLMEINSHIFEATRNSEESLEIERLLEVIDNLGAPEETLESIIADKKLAQATKSFNPKHIMQAILLKSKNHVSILIFGLIYFTLFSASFLLLAKIFFPEDTGLFYKDGAFHTLGFVKEHSQSQEVLGYWFYPIVIGIIGVLYVFNTLCLRLYKKK